MSIFNYLWFFDVVKFAFFFWRLIINTTSENVSKLPFTWQVVPYIYCFYTNYTSCCEGRSKIHCTFWRSPYFLRILRSFPVINFASISFSFRSDSLNEELKQEKECPSRQLTAASKCCSKILRSKLFFSVEISGRYDEYFVEVATQIICQTNLGLAVAQCCRLPHNLGY